MCLISMASTESRKKSDLEKRLKILRQQISGREKVSDTLYQVSSGINDSGKISHNSNSLNTVSDVTYLRTDLTKILILSACAIGFQFILLFLLKNHILNLNFF